MSFAADLLARLETMPAAQRVAIASAVPGRGDFSSATVAIEGQDRAEGGGAP